jgi:hypothetical protein
VIIDQVELRYLHRFICENQDVIFSEVSKRPTTMFNSVKLSSKDLARQRFSESPNSKLHAEAVKSIVAQLGPPVDVRRREQQSWMSAAGPSSNQYYDEFMKRYEGRILDSIRDKKIFYEAGRSKV